MTDPKQHQGPLGPDQSAPETQDVPAESKLTDWANEPTIGDLKQNLDDVASNGTQHTANVNRWADNFNITGSAKITTKANCSQIQPKLIRKQAEWRYSSLSEPFLASPDIFNVYPVTAGDRKRARQNALVLNNQFNTKLDKVALIDGIVREDVDVGTVVLKVGWETHEEEVEIEQPIINFVLDTSGQLAPRYDYLIQLKTQNPEGYMDFDRHGLDRALEIFMQTGQAYIVQETGDFETVTEIRETKNQPTVDILDSRNVIVDPTCLGNYKKAKFIAEHFKSSLDSLRKDGNYFNLDKIHIEAHSPLADPDYTEDDTEQESFSFKDNPRKQFVVTQYWGYWDINKNGVAVPILASWVGDVLIRMEKNPFPDNLPPYIFIQYMPVRRSVHGEPDGELLEDNQKVIGAVTRGMIDLMGKSANGQLGVRSDMLDVANRRKFNKGEDYEFRPGVDPRQGFHVHEFPEIPNSGYSMLQMQNNEAESLSGIKAFTSGITGDALGKSVMNGRSALDAASKREVGILRRVAAGLKEVARKIIAMNAEFLNEEEIVRVTAEEFVTVRRDDLGGHFDLELAISTPEEDNRKAEELAFMLQTNGPNSDPEEARLIKAEIARLRKMPGLAKIIEDYQPTPDPMQVKKMELEMVLLQNQGIKEQALAMKHAAEAEAAGDRGAKDRTQAALNIAKAGTEGSKATNLDSITDKNDLDFIQEESGVNQVRDLEKTAAGEAAKAENKPKPPPTKL